MKSIWGYTEAKKHTKVGDGSRNFGQRKTIRNETHRAEKADLMMKIEP